MSQATRILAALILGLVAGIAMGEWAPDATSRIAGWTDPIGTLWLNGLRMTIVPLVVALLVVGIARAARAASATAFAAKVLARFVALLWVFSALGGLMTLGLLALFPMPRASADALKSALSRAGDVGEVPPFVEFIKGMVPTNPINAAATDQLLPLIVFTLIFAFAVVRLPEPHRGTLVGLFDAIGEAMIIIINWVLRLAPVGVTALAFGLGARTGSAALGALAHYVLIVSSVGLMIFLLAFFVALAGKRSPGAFVRAMLPAWAVAISTQSSLASLPAMLRGADALGAAHAQSSVILPMAVAIFRATSPTMNVAVAFYIAHWYGIELTPYSVAIGIAAAAITTMGSVGLPGTISFVTSIAPINSAIGVPIEPLALLVAVETLPDIMRTLGNVTMDVAVTATIADRGDGDDLRETDVVPAPGSGRG